MLGRILVAMGLMASSALAQPSFGTDYAFTIADLNGNQRLSRAEYLHFQNMLLLAIDQNSDGKISAIEWRDWDPREYTGPTEGSVGRLVAAMARQFIAYDKNKDDYLSPEEFSAALFLDFDAANTTNSASNGLDRNEFAAGFLLPKHLGR